MQQDPNTSATPGSDEVMTALQRVLESEFFSNSERIRGFLEYIVVETLEGRGDRIKSYSIAIEVFGRDTDFDPTQDPLVRTTANRLRSALERYNNSPENLSEVVIRLPKGKYIPFFEKRSVPAVQVFDLHAAPALSTTGIDSQSVESTFAKPLFGWIAGLIAAGILVVAIVSTLVILAQSNTGSYATATSGRSVLLVRPTQATTNNGETIKIASGLSNLLVGGLAAQGRATVLNLESTDSAVVSRYAQEFRNDDLYILESSVRRYEEQLSLIWHLTDGRSNEVVWAKENLLGEASAVTPEHAADLLVAVVLGNEGAISRLTSLAGAGPSDRKQCLTRPLHLAPIEGHDLELMRTCLDALIREDATDAGAWGVLALVYYQMGLEAASFGRDPGAFSAQLRQAADEAMRLAPMAYTSQLAKVYVAFESGQFDDFDLIARDLLWRYGDPHLKMRLGASYLAIGMIDEGRQVIDLGLEESMEHQGITYLFLSLERYLADDYIAALAMADRAGNEDYYMVPLMRSIILAKLGRSEDATVEIANLERLRPAYGQIVYSDLMHQKMAESTIEKIVSGLQDAGLSIP